MQKSIPIYLYPLLTFLLIASKPIKPMYKTCCSIPGFVGTFQGSFCDFVINSFAKNGHVIFDEEDRTAYNSIAFYGPEGTGKATAARKFAESIQATLLEYECSDINYSDINSAYKQAEQLVKDTGKPVVILFKRYDRNITVSSMLRSNIDFKNRSNIYGKPNPKIVTIITLDNPKYLERMDECRVKVYHPFTLPSTKEREEIFKLHLAPHTHSIPPHTIKRLAYLTRGCSGRDIKEMIEAAVELANKDQNSTLEKKYLKKIINQSVRHSISDKFPSAKKVIGFIVLSIVLNLIVDNRQKIWQHRNQISMVGISTLIMSHPIIIALLRKNKKNNEAEKNSDPRINHDSH